MNGAPMKPHLRNAWRMALVGMLLALFMLGSDLVGIVVFGDAPAWREGFASAAVVMVLLAAGGAIYSMVLPRFARDHLPPTARAQVLAATTSGAATVGLLLGPLMLAGATADGLPVVGFLLAATAFGAFVGAVVGMFTPNHRRGSPPSS